MKLYRYNILRDLLEGESELAIIVATEPRDPALPPEMHWKDYHYVIPYSHFDALMAGGDLIEVSRRPVNVLTCVLYGLSYSGRAALLALPNFDKRLPRQIGVKVG